MMREKKFFTRVMKTLSTRTPNITRTLKRIITKEATLIVNNFNFLNELNLTNVLMVVRNLTIKLILSVPQIKNQLQRSKRSIKNLIEERILAGALLIDNKLKKEVSQLHPFTSTERLPWC